ncbi:hypothetical protein B1759_16730 [Rubrivirga sp. SAORIC476]|uniref:hypothetical protein n=1 Tax=Rubrivirga sp. SAORIC476 TaxID=1961794 RepID=UPI000BA99BA6|nr:hypothetical protein [Rubrivirga sp. SAORIC476]PAP74820.1 hypothetical protein B1759_16730 [Rubrivirga sp. SAORIC476]
MSTLPVPAFDAQFNPDDLAEWRESFVGYVADFTAEDNPDPVGETLDEMIAAFDFEPEPTRADLDRWRAELDAEIAEALPDAIARVSLDRAASAFEEMRAKGRTVASIARSLGLAPEAVALLAADRCGELSRKRTRAAHAVRAEDRAHRQHRARTRSLGKLQGKVEAALDKADFTALPADKLADLLIRLAELARTDEPPALAVNVGGRTI